MRCLVAFVSLAVAAAASSSVISRVEYEKRFFDWMQKYNIQPETPEKFVHFLDNYIASDQIITRHNANPNATFTLGHNIFSHMSSKEFREFVARGGVQRPDFHANAVHKAPMDVTALPPSMDWTKRGAVTDVQYQGQCGACWSFAATGAIEGAVQIKYGKLIKLSEQNLLDCDNTNSGCVGGLPDKAFMWAKSNGGICTEAGYPYTSAETGNVGKCSQSSCIKSPNSAPKSYTNVDPNSDYALMSALVKQPVSVLVDADTWQLYSGGVYSAADCGTQLNHAVLAVGYGSMSGQDYYKVKNTWGTQWGVDGYIYLARGIRNPEGQCGILGYCTFPVV